MKDVSLGNADYRRKEAEFGASVCTPNDTRESQPHLATTFKSLSRRIGGKTENKNGVGYDGSSCHDPYSQRKIGEKEWIWAFLESILARKLLLWQLLSLGERICVTSFV